MGDVVAESGVKIGESGVWDALPQAVHAANTATAQATRPLLTKAPVGVVILRSDHVVAPNPRTGHRMSCVHVERGGPPRGLHQENEWVVPR